MVWHILARHHCTGRFRVFIRDLFNDWTLSPASDISGCKGKLLIFVCLGIVQEDCLVFISCGLSNIWRWGLPICTCRAGSLRRTNMDKQQISPETATASLADTCQHMHAQRNDAFFTVRDGELHRAVLYETHLISIR